MFDILSVIPGKKKSTTSGWTSFNAICCSYRGHKADKRMRGGLKFENDVNWRYHCFNCGFSCNFILGKAIVGKTQTLLKWCGVDDRQIGKWSLDSLKHKDLIEYVKVKKHKSKVKFKEYKLPDDAELIDIANPEHNKFVEYLESRKLNVTDYPFMVTPNALSRYANRIIIPFTHKHMIVGNTSRFLDNKTPKYLNEQQAGYVFGFDFQKPDWSICILVEGIFDALSINGCALGHNNISDIQAQVLSELNRQIIFVPDHDKTGLSLTDRALDLGYSVSIPEWENDVKDVNDAVIKYGKLATLLSIIQNSTTSKIKVEMRKKQIGK